MGSEKPKPPHTWLMNPKFCLVLGVVWMVIGLLRGRMLLVAFGAIWVLLAALHHRKNTAPPK